MPDTPSTPKRRSSDSAPTDRRLEIRRVAIDSLTPDVSNPRLHGPRNLDAIKASLRRFGQVEPLVVQAGTNRLVAGHGRLEAMKALGWTEVDVVEVPLDNVSATALNISLNRTAELGEWSEPTLAKLLAELRAEDEIEATGFSDKEIDDLLADLGGDVEATEVNDPGPIDPAESAVTRLGDVWLLGAHKLMCGDSTKAETIARLLNGEKAALMATDPPYMIDYTGADRPAPNGGSAGKDWTNLYNEVEIEDAEGFVDQFLTACLPHLVEDAAIYCFHAHRRYPLLVEVFERHKLLIHQQLVWVKPTATFGHSVFRWRHEPCLLAWLKGHKPRHSGANYESVWECDWDGKNRISSFHPTSKPPRVFQIAMEVHSRPGEIVLEPFSGSGSQIIAAERLSRKCRAVEKQPVFCDGSVRRWQQATGKTAILDGMTKTFDEIATERGIDPSKS